MKAKEIYQRIKSIPSIDTFTFESIKTLLGVVGDLKDFTVLEIGSAHGRSAMAWKLAGAKEVITVDIQDALSQEVENRVTFVHGDSLTIPWDRKVDIVFIDGDHSYEGCLGDLRKYMPFATKVICGHDYSDNFPSVKRAVDDFFGKLSLNKDDWFIVKK